MTSSARQFALVTGALAALGAVAGLAMFGGVMPALVLAVCVAATPLAAYRVRRQRLRATAQEAWPRLIEEIRIRTSGLGRSVPQALFEAGERAPASLRPAFAAAQREWVLSTDFERTVAVLKDGLADPTADAACETLLVAHEVGGSDLDRRLEALIEDRVIDVQGRKDARSKQAGVRFARTVRAAGAVGHGAGGHVDGQRAGRLRHAVGPDDGGHRDRLGGGVLGVGRPAAQAARRAAGLLRVGATGDGVNQTQLLAVAALALFAGSTLLLSQIRWFRRRPLVDRLAPYVPGGSTARQHQHPGVGGGASDR